MTLSKKELSKAWQYLYWHGPIIDTQDSEITRQCSCWKSEHDEYAWNTNLEPKNGRIA
jgi:hypothetical protein